MRLVALVITLAIALSGLLIAQTNPGPTINRLSPEDISPGKGDLKLTITGSGFVPESVVAWNGARVVTVFTSSSQLTATVPASDTATAGTASVTVTNPIGVISNARTFAVELILFDKSHFNLLMSAVVLLGGLGIYWFWHPHIFHEHPFVEKAFEFYVLKWIAYVVIWGLVTSQTDSRFVLAADDLNTIIGFGFVIAMWKGDSYEERHSAINLAFFFGLLFAWNFIMFPSPGAPGADLPFREGITWLFPSMTASLVLIAAMGMVTIARCGLGAIPFAVAIGAYCFLQLPTYEAVYRIGRNYESYNELVKYLAFGKILCGTLFYQLFPMSLKKFDAIKFAFAGATWSDTRFKRAAGWAGATISAAILTALVDAIARKVL